MSERKCTVEGCWRTHQAHGLCAMHWQRKKLGITKYHVLRSDNLRRVNLDSVAVGWLRGVLDRLP